MTKNTPLVSIITIVFNPIKNGRKKLLAKCIESVQKQTYDNLEHIIIDGASNDGTINFLNKYQEIGSIKFFSSPDNGIYNAMNKGVSKSKGKYLSFLNSDDFFHNQDGIKNVVDCFEKNNCSMVYSDVFAIDSRNNKVAGLWHANINQLPYGTHFCHQGTFIKKDILLKYGCFDEEFKISADSDLVIKLFAAGEKLTYLGKPFASYRSGGLSNLNPELNRKEHSNSFYKYVGKNCNLSRRECYQLWNFSLFNELKGLEIFNIYKKLKKTEWKDELFKKFIELAIKTNSFNSNLSPNKQESFTRTEIRMIFFIRRVKNFIMPENSFIYQILMKLKMSVKKYL